MDFDNFTLEEFITLLQSLVEYYDTISANSDLGEYPHESIETLRELLRRYHAAEG